MSENRTRGGGELRAARLARGLSQEQLARQADCSTRMIYLFEAGFSPAHSEVRERIEAILSINGEDPGQRSGASARQGDLTAHGQD